MLTRRISINTYITSSPVGSFYTNVHGINKSQSRQTEDRRPGEREREREKAGMMEYCVGRFVARGSTGIPFVDRSTCCQLAVTCLARSNRRDESTNKQSYKML